MLTLLSISVALAIAVGTPLYSIYSDRLFESRRARGDKGARLKEYSLTTLFLWTLTVVAIAVWLFEQRELGALGLGAPTDWQFMAATAAAVVVSSLAVYQARKVTSDPNLLESARGQFGGAEKMLPHNAKEYRRFIALSLTAGFTEEVLFRGFLIWALSFWFSPWIAGLIALLPFMASHLYLGTAGAIKSGLAGAILTALYLFSGSLWPAILVHAIVDWTSGHIGYKSLAQPPGTESAQS